MDQSHIDLKAEQQATLARPRYRYSLAARCFFRLMDLVTGNKTTLAKTVLIETLASIPYRAWELRQYSLMTQGYTDGGLVRLAGQIMRWGREAQDNEYWHLLVINEKIKEDGARRPWYLFPAIPFLMVWTYGLFAGALARLNIRRGFLFNAEFEDHAEHVYAQFVADHPEWEQQPVTNPLVKQYGEMATWADVFRRIGLDERDHMNNSFVFFGKPENVARYSGMPPVPAVKGALIK